VLLSPVGIAIAITRPPTLPGPRDCQLAADASSAGVPSGVRWSCGGIDDTCTMPRICSLACNSRSTGNSAMPGARRFCR